MAIEGILLYYKYVDLRHHREGMCDWMSELCGQSQLKGRARIAYDGVNVTVGGTLKALQQHIEAVSEHPLLGADIDFKLAPSEGACSEGTRLESGFNVLNIRKCEELVTLGPLAQQQANPFTSAAQLLSPGEFHALLQEAANCQGPVEGTVLLDARNLYESRIGHFQASDVPLLLPRTRCFSDLPAWIDEHQDELRGRRVMMYCTGGVRCERASAYLREKGAAFAHVYQLRGGIQRYLEAFPDGGFFRGKNFVYDERSAVGAERGTGVVVGRCGACSAPCDDYGARCRCSACRMLLLLCAKCQAETSRDTGSGGHNVLPRAGDSGGDGCDMLPSAGDSGGDGHGPLPSAGDSGGEGHDIAPHDGDIGGDGHHGLPRSLLCELCLERSAAQRAQHDGASVGPQPAQAEGPAARRLRILCLHGFRQTAKQFQGRTNALRKKLKDLAEFVFVDAPHALPSYAKEGAAPPRAQAGDYGGRAAQHGAARPAQEQPQEQANTLPSFATEGVAPPRAQGGDYGDHAAQHGTARAAQEQAHASDGEALQPEEGREAAGPSSSGNGCGLGGDVDGVEAPVQLDGGEVAWEDCGEHEAVPGAAKEGRRAAGSCHAAAAPAAARRAWLLSRELLLAAQQGGGAGGGPWQPAPGFVGEEQLQHQTLGWAESWALLQRVLEQQGPFDGVLGFSQGAPVVAALCAEQQLRMSRPMQCGSCSSASQPAASCSHGREVAADCCSVGQQPAGCSSGSQISAESSGDGNHTAVGCCAGDATTAASCNSADVSRGPGRNSSHGGGLGPSRAQAHVDADSSQSLLRQFQQAADRGATAAAAAHASHLDPAAGGDAASSTQPGSRGRDGGSGSSLSCSSSPGDGSQGSPCTAQAPGMAAGPQSPPGGGAGSAGVPPADGHAGDVSTAAGAAPAACPVRAGAAGGGWPHAWRLRFAVLASGYPSAASEICAALQAAGPLSLPSLHIFGVEGNDRQVSREESEALCRAFDPSHVSVLRHSSGHIIPVAKTQLAAMRAFLKRFV